MSIDRPESAGPPMFDLTKQPDAHTYHRSPITNGGPRRIGDPYITITAHQNYDDGRDRTYTMRFDLLMLLRDRARIAGVLEREMLHALATIGVKL